MSVVKSLHISLQQIHKLSVERDNYHKIECQSPPLKTTYKVKLWIDEPSVPLQLWWICIRVFGNKKLKNE